MGYILMNVGVNNRASTINQIFVGVNNIARLVYQGGGGSGNFQLPTFTGSSSIFGDTTSGRIELYETGTLTLSPGTYDVFLVGGGGNGGAGGRVSGTNYHGSGGGGGYTETHKGISIAERTEVAITVGSATGSSSFLSAGLTISYSVNGGTSANYGITAGNGGSGGGGGGKVQASAGNGGSDGSDGESGTWRGGTGQHSTTRMFGVENSTLYAGGGGGAGDSSDGTGGAGGGGNGGGRGANGTANTGGGGGGSDAVDNISSGGSGIVIVRWNNAGGNYSPTLADNTWAQIDAACKANDPILDSWKVGDEKDAVINGETLTFVIVGKNHDDLADGSGKAKLSFTTKNLLSVRKRMSNTDSETNFFTSELYTTFLSNTEYNGMESELKNAVKAVRKICATSSQAATTTQECYIWIPSQWEVFGETSGTGATPAKTGEKYEYFVTNTERIKRMSNGSGATEKYWTRDRATGRVGCYVAVESNGTLSWSAQTDVSNTGICFGFCI